MSKKKPEIKFNDERFWILVEQLGEKERAKSFRQAYNAAGKRVRQIAIGYLHGRLRPNSTRDNKNLDKGVRSRTFKKKIGFKVTVSPEGKRGYHVNRYGKEKPCLMWLEDGTSKRKVRGGFIRSGHSTGEGPALKFMETAHKSAAVAVNANLKEDLMKKVVKIAKNNGCKV